jgi:hypothetical protein
VIRAWGSALGAAKQPCFPREANYRNGFEPLSIPASCREWIFSLAYRYAHKPTLAPGKTRNRHAEGFQRRSITVFLSQFAASTIDVFRHYE